MLKVEGRWAAKIEELLTPHTVDEEKPEPRILTEDEGGCAYCGAELPFSFQARRFCHDGCKVMAAKRRAMGKPEARGLGVEATANCECCGAEFTYLKRGKPRNTCSVKCQRALMNRRRQAQRLHRTPTS